MPGSPEELVAVLREEAMRDLERKWATVDEATSIGYALSLMRLRASLFGIGESWEQEKGMSDKSDS